jgi:hypothetical protein
MTRRGCMSTSSASLVICLKRHDATRGAPFGSDFSHLLTWGGPPSVLASLVRPPVCASYRPRMRPRSLATIPVRDETGAIFVVIAAGVSWRRAVHHPDRLTDETDPRTTTVSLRSARDHLF